MIRLELPHINVLSKADQTQHFEGGGEEEGGGFFMSIKGGA